MSATGLQPLNTTTIVVFGLFLITTLLITLWAMRRTRTKEDFFVAGRSVTASQNGLALAGDFMGAATLLGVVGLVSLRGFDGLIYAVGGLVGWPILVMLIAEPMRVASGASRSPMLCPLALNNVPSVLRSLLQRFCSCPVT